MTVTQPSCQPACLFSAGTHTSTEPPAQGPVASATHGDGVLRDGHTSPCAANRLHFGGA